MDAVHKWIGNSQPVAAEQHLEVTEEHCRPALRLVQIPAQSVQELRGSKLPQFVLAISRLQTVPVVAIPDGIVGTPQVTPTGFEPVLQA